MRNLDSLLRQEVNSSFGGGILSYALAHSTPEQLFTQSHSKSHGKKRTQQRGHNLHDVIENATKKSEKSSAAQTGTH